jgi:hypothetical protein
MIMNGEQVRTWMDVVMVYLKVHLPGNAEENHDIPQKGFSSSYSMFLL